MIYIDQVVKEFIRIPQIRDCNFDCFEKIHLRFPEAVMKSEIVLFEDILKSGSSWSWHRFKKIDILVLKILDLSA